MSEKEWDKYREILWLNEYPNKKMDNGWFKNRKLFIEKKLKKHEKTIKEN
jgi:hypothetical protein